MMLADQMRRHPVFILCVAAGWLGLPACSTQEISPDPVTVPDSMPSADHGALQIALAPREVSFEEHQAYAETHSAVFFHVFFDGQQLVWSSDVDGSLEPIVVGEAGSARTGYLPAGLHHFDIRAPGTGSTVYSGGGQIAAGSMTELFLFGPAGAIEGRFVSYPVIAAAGTAHVAVVNLIRTGQSLEVVSCVDATHCAPVSSPIAVGEAFEGDFPMDATQDWPNGRFVTSNGAALGYRQVPTAVVSDPPVVPLSYRVAPLDGAMPPSATLVAAPIYMSPSGDVEETF